MSTSRGADVQGAYSVHELSITQSVVDVVTKRTGDNRVAKVRLQIGKLSGIVPDSVRFWRSTNLPDVGTAERAATTSNWAI